jgi:hypothetical protein
MDTGAMSVLKDLQRAVAARLPHEATSDDRRRHAALCVEAMIVAIETGHLSYGDWERYAVLQALSALKSGCTALAVDFARMALLPERKRMSRLYSVPDATPQDLREAYLELAA